LPGWNDLTPDWVRKGRGAEIKTIVGR
jgi:hypothetical protein